MWKTTYYKISLDKCMEDKAQNVTGIQTVVINSRITKRQFKDIMKILKSEE